MLGGYGEKGTLIHCWCKLMQPLWGNSMEVSQKTKNRTTLPYDPVIPLLGIYLREMKTHPNKNLYMNILSSIIYNSQKMETTQCPSADE